MRSSNARWRAHVARHPLVWFVAVSYAYSWAWWVPMAVRGDVVRDGVGVPTHVFGLLGPLVGALVVSAAEGGPALRDLLRRMARFAVPGRFWLLLAGTLLLGGVAVAVAGQWSGHDLLAYSGIGDLGLFGVPAAALLLNGYGEETGWRGFLVERLLQRHDALSTSVRVAVVWAGWHAPMFFVVSGLRGLGIATVGWVVGILTASLVLTWMYRGSGHSIAYLALWHTAYNFTSATTATKGVPQAVTTTAVTVLAAVVLVRELRRRRASGEARLPVPQ